jgi:hypothetical protein
LQWNLTPKELYTGDFTQAQELKSLIRFRTIIQILKKQKSHKNQTLNKNQNKTKHRLTKIKSEYLINN